MDDGETIGGDARAGSSTDPGDGDDKAESIQAELVPHEGHVTITKVSDSTFMIVHNITLERKKLPTATWGVASRFQTVRQGGEV